MQDYHAEFVEIYNKNITRPGADRLLNWLETTDFFTAPASTRFHGACECGLVMHSINVYNAMMQHFYTEGENAESYAICGLLHDLCKANFYKVSTRNVKNDATGQWEKVPFYQVADQLPYGHGEKSVYLIEHFMRLKTAEAIAIRWHMGGFDDAARGGCFAVSEAYHIVNKPSAKEGVCDRCGGELAIRKDDEPATVLDRLKAHHEQTEPLVEFYRQRGKLVEVPDQGSIEATTAFLLKLLEA